MVIGVARFYDVHQMGEHTTHPIARFLGHGSLLLLLAWDGSPRKRPLRGNVSQPHTELSRLMKRQLAIRLGCQKTTAKSLVIAQQPKKRTLGCVQLPNLE